MGRHSTRDSPSRVSTDVIRAQQVKLTGIRRIQRTIIVTTFSLRSCLLRQVTPERHNLPRLAVAAQKRLTRLHSHRPRALLDPSRARPGLKLKQSATLDVSLRYQVNMGKGGFYAVARGRKTGIFDSW